MIHNDDFRLVGKLHKHTELTVRFKARKDPGSVVIIKKLAAEFQIKLVVKFTDAFANMFGLHLQIFVIVKSCLHLFISCPFHQYHKCLRLGGFLLYCLKNTLSSVYYKTGDL